MEEVLDNTKEIARLSFEIKALLLSIKKTWFNGDLIKELEEKIPQLDKLLSTVAVEIQLEILINLLEKIAELQLEEKYKDTLEDMFSLRLIQVMQGSRPHQGLNLALSLIGRCLGVINNFSSPEKIRELLETRGPGNFHMFYYFQHAVRDCIGYYNPRHYNHINSLIVGRKLLRSIKGAWELPSIAVVEDEIRHKFVSFNIQAMLCQCVSANNGFQRKTAEFLIDQCGADIEKAGYGFTFLQKALAMIDVKDEESLDAFKFYLARQNNPEKVREQVNAIYKREFGFCEKDHELYKPEYESYGISARVKYVMAIAFLEPVGFVRAFADISVSAAAKFRSPVQVAQDTPEGAVKALRVKQLLERYKENDNDLAEITTQIDNQLLDDEEMRLLVAEATEMNKKLGKDIQSYITYKQSQKVAPK